MGLIVIALISGTPMTASGMEGDPEPTTLSSALGKGENTPHQQPMYFTFSPLETGAIESRLDTGLSYSPIGRTHLMVLGVAGQYVLADRLELGLSMPLLTRNGQLAGSPNDEFEFGNLTAGAKFEVARKNRNEPGSSLDYALSIFANGTAPTSTGQSNRNWALIHAGVAASVLVKENITIGANVGAWWLLQTDTDHHWSVVFDAFGAVRLDWLGLQLAIQSLIPVDAPGELALAVTPAVRFFPLPRIFTDVGARISISNPSKLFYSGGVAMLIANVGMTL